jgi:hypothetical protein
MADAVSTSVVFNGTRIKQYRFTNRSDGTGESDVVKIDISTLVGLTGVAPTKLQVLEVSWTIQGFTSVQLEWDASTDVVTEMLTGSGYRDYMDSGGLVDPMASGATGDLLLTTYGAASNATYDIFITVKLKV